MTDTIASAVDRFIAHKRAHGRKYHSEARELALLVRFAANHQVGRLSWLTPALLEDFLASRPRPHPRSFNHLLGVVRCLLDWAVTWGLLEASRWSRFAVSVPAVPPPRMTTRWIMIPARAGGERGQAPVGVPVRRIRPQCHAA